MNKPTPTSGDIEAIIAAIDDNTKFLPLPVVEEIVGFKSTHIYQLIKDKSFPPPLKLASRKSVWLSSQITTWKKQIAREHLTKNTL